MQTFCLLEELLCIGGTVYCSILQTGDKAFWEPAAQNLDCPAEAILGYHWVHPLY